MRAVLAAFLAFALANAWADDEAPATTPYRPSVSTPAALSAPGWLEVEAGWQQVHDAGSSRRESLPVTLKLAFSPDWGVRIGNEAWVRERSDAGSRSGFGDTAVVLKRRFAVDDAQAFGLEAGAAFPTGKNGIGGGSGKADYAVVGIYSADFGAWHTDMNLVATRLGQVDAGSARTQWLWAASLSRSLDDRWGVVGEVSGTNQGGAAATSQLLLAASYNVDRRLTFDAGLARSLRDSGWSAFAGMTWLAARLF